MAWRCDEFVPYMRSEELKAMARMLGGSGQLRKDECIPFIPAVLNDPSRLQAALDRLSQNDRLALAVVNQFNGVMPSHGLALAMRTLRESWPESRRNYHQNDTMLFVHPLVRRGLLFYADGPSDSGMYGYGSRLVVADERILARIDAPEVEPFTLAPAPTPDIVRARRPQAISLDLVAALQTVNSMGGLRLTRARQRSIRTADLTKLFKLMGWAGDRDIDGVTFPQFGDAFLYALTGSGLLHLAGDVLMPAIPVEQLAEQPYEMQVKLLLNGFLQADAWVEWQGDRYETPVVPAQAVTGRYALTAALMALPDTSDTFFRLENIDQAWYARVGENFSLGYALTYGPNTYGRSDAQQKSDLEQWRAGLRKSWIQRERVWSQHAITTWAYALGLVELGLDGQQVVSVRLTDLGRVVLRPHAAQPESLTPALAPASSPAGAAPAIVVQPNFDILVYLDRVRPADMAFLERYLERAQVQQHTAHYRLTRDSIYRGLESGITSGDLLDRLAGLNGGSLPQNVQVEIRQWAAARERISLRRFAQLVEFADSEDRDAAVQRGIRGTPIGDRFMLLAPDSPRPRVQRQVDHNLLPVRCLSVEEDGQLLLDSGLRDVVIEAELDGWAERQSPDCWLLTRVSVSSAIQQGRRTTDLFKWLDARRKSLLPAWLRVAIQSWAGGRTDATLMPAVVLHVRLPDACEAIAASATLRPHLQARVGVNTWIIKPGHEAALREKLAWAGLQMDMAIEPVSSR